MCNLVNDILSVSQQCEKLLLSVRVTVPASNFTLVILRLLCYHQQEFWQHAIEHSQVSAISQARFTHAWSGLIEYTYLLTLPVTADCSCQRALNPTAHMWLSEYEVHR